MGCLDENRVLDLVRGRAAGQPLADAESHLAVCDDCVRLFAEAAVSVSGVAPRGAAPNDVGDLPETTTLRAAEGEPGAVAVEPGSLAPGTLLNDTYRVIRFIGRGGMGEVYEIAHARLSGRYAAKVLTQQIPATDEIISRFRREAQITSALRHPNIVQVMDFNWTSHGRPFLVMEYLEGVHLGRVIHAEGPLTLARVLQIVGPVVSALGAVHRSGVIHRDLKPPNIMLLPGLDRTGEVVKLLDFGLSKRTDRDVSESLLVSRERMLLGTPLYMAPEQVRGETETVGSAADQFALAAIIYEMLTRRAAFAGDCLETVLYRIAHVEPEAMSQQIAGVPVAVDRVVQRALSKNAAARFSSIGAFYDAFREAGGTQRLAERDAASGSAAVHLGATSKELTGEVLAAIPRPRGRRGRASAWAGLALGASLGLFLLAEKRRAPPTPALPAPARLALPARGSPPVGEPISTPPGTPPTAAIQVAPRTPDAPAVVEKPRPRGTHVRGRVQHVAGPKLEGGEEVSILPLAPPVSPAAEPSVGAPTTVPPAPPAIERTPPAAVPRPRVGGFTKL